MQSLPKIKGRKGKSKSLIKPEIIIGIIGIIFSVFVAYHIYFIQRQVKKLDVVLLANTHLIDSKNRSTIEIILSDTKDPNEDIYFVQTKVINTGNQPILESEFLKPLTFVFPTKVKFIQADTVESNPSDIGATLQTDQNTVYLTPVLLNPTDQIVLKFFVKLESSELPAIPFEINSRIVGVQKVQIVNSIQTVGRTGAIVTTTVQIMASIFLLFVGIGVIFGKMSYQTGSIIGGSLIIIVIISYLFQSFS